MARLSRLYAPGVIQLVQARLARPLAAVEDPTPAGKFDLLLTWLRTEAATPDLALHAWVLLHDRFILLATPANPDTMPRLVQGVGRRMAAGMVHGRVFEGRYRSALIEAAWLVDCMVWAESLPVHMGVVDTAIQWPWSSARAHVGMQTPAHAAGLADHPAYWHLGDTPFARQARYQECLEAGLSPGRLRLIEQAVQGQWALGDVAFLQKLRSEGARRARPAPRGRPRKPTVTN